MITPGINTPMTVTRSDATILLLVVRAARAFRDLGDLHAQAIPGDSDLLHAERMLVAALERIRDTERRRAA